MADAVLKTQPRPELVTSVLAVDDQPVFLRAVRELINATAGMFVVGEARRGEEAVERVENLRPDLVLMDVYMPGLGGVQAAREIKAAHPSTVIALLSTTHPDELSCQGVTCPADALIWKSDLRPSVLEEIWQRYRPPPAA
jgi:two-component system, NarL family, invasion response regulator UvrY